MKRYKSKPVEVKALYFKEDGSNHDEVKEFMGSAIKSDHYLGSSFLYFLFDNGADGEYLMKGEYAVKYPDGHFEKYRKEDFLEEFEEVL